MPATCTESNRHVVGRWTCLRKRSSELRQQANTTGQFCAATERAAGTCTLIARDLGWAPDINQQ